MNRKFWTISELKSLSPSSYYNLEGLIKSFGFPCLFAINSFYKNHMFVCDLSTFVVDENFYEELKTQLNLFIEYKSKLNSAHKNFYTLLILVPQIEASNPKDIENFIFDLLINLKKIDSTEQEINKKDILSKDYEFSLDNNIWFPVFLCPNHITKIRQSPISLIAFQPKETFESLKSYKNNFYEKTRQATHKRIDKIYNGHRPFFLTSDSSGINAMQYLGFDPSNPLA